MTRKPKDVSDTHRDMDWLTTPEVAALLRVHPKHVYRLLRQGLPARRVGGQWRFSRDDVREWAIRRGDADHSISLRTESAGPTLISAEPGPILDGLQEALAAADASLAFVPALRTQRVKMLASRSVNGAVMGGEETLSFPAVRVHVAVQEFGLFGIEKESGSIALPSVDSDAGMALEQVTLPDFAPEVFASDAECAFAVARGSADLGFGRGWWADRLGLPFQPMISMSSELVVPVDPSCMRAMAPVLEGIRSGVIASFLGRGRWIDVGRCGETRCDPVERKSGLVVPRSCAGSLEGRRTPRWLMMPRDGSTVAVMDIVDRLRARGIRLGGFLQVPCGTQNHTVGYDLVRLGRPERIALADRERGFGFEQGFRKLSFRAEAIASAWRWLQDDAREADVLIIDGVGKLEGRGKGHFPALLWARNLEQPKVVVLSVRREVISSIHEKLSISEPISEELWTDEWVDRIHRCCMAASSKESRTLS